ncbi:conserved hypothetical protein [Histoplasma mississippiense (nom. inval.)]|uniref:conserved hypothetical protein n=1 Tax=Ajellomyces capsulatus (strain NAm1 / WU24) TaxID=2059318 RepID=UPI000157C575|nr:conserved hypothetical protein [Histoplasma mississippiense (nom. inval.)]EDN08277.1 conserved hypothetical protein [Histoplasma mississippiense (nom. inval.)]
MYPVGFDVNVEEEMIAGRLGPKYTIDADSAAVVVLARDSRRIQDTFVMEEEVLFGLRMESMTGG